MSAVVKPAGTVLASRAKGSVTWQARISDDRGRLEVVGLVPPSVTPTEIAPLDERELRELLWRGRRPGRGDRGRT